jgi:hypothetical protein
VECDAPGYVCNPIDKSCDQVCGSTLCTTNTVCNPRDNTCHCGTPDGTVCEKCGCVLFVVDGGPLAPGQDAGGAATYGRCIACDPCNGVTCPPLETCDVNNNGACECGGDPNANLPGTVCAANQSCVAPLDGGEPACEPN